VKHHSPRPLERAWRHDPRTRGHHQQPREVDDEHRAAARSNFDGSRSRRIREGSFDGRLVDPP
jgi:hypothetical protein